MIFINSQHDRLIGTSRREAEIASVHVDGDGFLLAGAQEMTFSHLLRNRQLILPVKGLWIELLEQSSPLMY